MPVYDHHQALPRLVDALRTTGLTCWLVDDGSHAPCAQAVQALCAENQPWLRRLRLEHNQGKGGAVVAGLRAAHAAGFTHAVQIDADLQHPPEMIPRLLQQAKRTKSDLVMGSRLAPGGDASSLGVKRMLISHAFALTTRASFPQRLRTVTDPLTGFFLTRKFREAY